PKIDAFAACQRQSVYNLEIHGSHVFQVSTHEMVSHNASSLPRSGARGESWKLPEGPTSSAPSPLDEDRTGRKPWWRRTLSAALDGLPLFPSEADAAPTSRELPKSVQERSPEQPPGDTISEGRPEAAAIAMWQRGNREEALLMMR